MAPRYKDIGVTPRPHTQKRAPVVIVGAGPVGLTAALDLGRRGHEVIVLNQLDFIPAGSKAICFSKRTLDIWNRLGVGARMVDKGVVWNVGKVFRGAETDPLIQFDLLPVKNQRMPGFINLQQYYAEEFLIDAVAAVPNIDVRWGHQVTGLEMTTDGVRLEVGTYTIDADWVIACDGSRSTVRALMGLDFEGRGFEDNFLIADVKFNAPRPPERWFWFDPPWGGASSLVHKQPDDVWRMDFQLGRNIDREAAIRPENVEPLVRGMVGDDIAFTPVWYSIYTFQCRRMARFVHGRVLFAGDAAHLVSPFGARGCNGGVADADNLAWKLDLVLRRQAPATLLESYNDEAIITADENIKNSTRTTDFMAPKTAADQAWREAVLELAKEHVFAQPFINAGRLSTAVHYPDSALNTPDTDTWTGGVPPGSPAVDAPFQGGWLLEQLGGGFKVLSTEGAADIQITDDAMIAERYDLKPGTTYLIRPDQYVAARWRRYDADAIEHAIQRACGQPL